MRISFEQSLRPDASLNSDMVVAYITDCATSPANFSQAPARVGNFQQKNNSAEDGIDGTNAYFRRNSGCSAEQKISEFRSEPFRGRENISEFRSVEQKYKQTLRMISEPFRNSDRGDRHERQGTQDKYMINFAVRISEAAMRRGQYFLGCRVAHLK